MKDLLKTTYLKIDGFSIYSSYLQALSPRVDGLTLILLHGAGQSNSKRFDEIAQSFADVGISVVRLDFVGHGETGGEPSNNSLSLRTKHSLAAIEHWVSKQTPLIICGSSMSGHTALRVTKRLGQRVKNLCLLQPAIYAAEAEDVLFDQEFTAILHKHESWRSSPALQDAQSFKGKSLIVIGSEDKVIPWGVIEALTQALKQNSSQFCLEVVGGFGHGLPTWLPERPKLSRRIVEYLADF